MLITTVSLMVIPESIFSFNQDMPLPTSASTFDPEKLDVRSDFIPTVIESPKNVIFELEAEEVDEEEDEDPEELLNLSYIACAKPPRTLITLDGGSEEISKLLCQKTVAFSRVVCSFNLSHSFDPLPEKPAAVTGRLVLSWTRYSNSNFNNLSLSSIGIELKVPFSSAGPPYSWLWYFFNSSGNLLTIAFLRPNVHCARPQTPLDQHWLA